MSSITILLLMGGLGGLLPDILRFVKDNSTASDYKSGVKIISLIFQVGLGVLAVYLLIVLDLKELADLSSKLAINALGLGFAAPELITRAVSSASPASPPSAPEAENMMLESHTPARSKSYMDWWRV